MVARDPILLGSEMMAKILYFPLLHQPVVVLVVVLVGALVTQVGLVVAEHLQMVPAARDTHHPHLRFRATMAVLVIAAMDQVAVEVQVLLVLLALPVTGEMEQQVQYLVLQ